MFELLTDLPPNVLGIRAVGEVTEADYRNVLVPEVEKRLGEFGKLRLLYVLGEQFAGFSAGAAWEDTRVGMRHLTDFDRIAVVTEVAWLANTVKAMGFLLPGTVRVFGNGQETEAREWITEPPARGTLSFELDTERGLLVLEPQDELEAEDFRRVGEVVDPYIESRGALSGLVVIAGEFPGWSSFAAFSAHLRFIREHQARVRRVALVTDSRLLALMPKFGSLFVNAEVRRFAPAERMAALDWAAGGKS